MNENLSDLKIYEERVYDIKEKLEFYKDIPNLRFLR